jgi:hypothetical protein
MTRKIGSASLGLHCHGSTANLIGRGTDVLFAWYFRFAHSDGHRKASGNARVAEIQRGAKCA